MRENLEKYYNMVIDDYFEYNQGIIFFFNNVKYYFITHSYEEDYLEYLINFTKELRLKGIILHDLIYNIEGKINSDGWVLMKVNCFTDTVSEEEKQIFYNIRNFNKEIYDNFVSINKLWWDKIDYFEYQLTELSSNVAINNSFDYYVGITELLLQLLESYGFQDIKPFISLAHRRMKNFDTIEFYNPLNVIIDISTRDLALFVKSSHKYELLDKYLDNSELNYAYYYLFVRLILPYRYFDLLEEVLIDKKDENELIQLINDNDRYEEEIEFFSKEFRINFSKFIKKSN